MTHLTGGWNGSPSRIQAATATRRVRIAILHGGCHPGWGRGEQESSSKGVGVNTERRGRKSPVT